VNVPAIREPQNQWWIVLEEGFEDHMPTPGSFPQEENQEFSYAFMSTLRGDREAPGKPWTQGESPDRNGEFSFLSEQPVGGKAGLEKVIEELHDEVNRDSSSTPDAADALAARRTRRRRGA